MTDLSNLSPAELRALADAAEQRQTAQQQRDSEFLGELHGRMRRQWAPASSDLGEQIAAKADPWVGVPLDPGAPS
ncbi:hypothetical protein [Capillimicrobium parvum]|uniref:Uncharacterized protein n=1 Tax=Capillimicrobium parvum TaxID=2884022 RepID=A0A9E7C6Q9_9ACTN|nr:hypothetical protein [Capillimicrobium parvum]UGS38938.1 hypothetical protein DSM104329_05370 [Capillimicrobium parvum]